MFRSLFAAFHHPQPVTESETLQGVRWLKTEVQKYICHHRASFQHFFGFSGAAAGGQQPARFGRFGGFGRSPEAAANSVSINDYCRRASPLFQKNFYGGHPELVAAANVLRAVIAVHHSNGRAYDTTIYPSTQPVKEIHLKYSGRNHYDWLEKTQSTLLMRAMRSRGSRGSRGAVGARGALGALGALFTRRKSAAPAAPAVKPRTRAQTQARNIAKKYLSTLGLNRSLETNARAQLKATPFSNGNHRQFLRNHGYDHAAGHADALILAHMVRAQHEHRAFEKLMTSTKRQPKRQTVRAVRRRSV
jgi:hypothetical protein